MSLFPILLLKVTSQATLGANMKKWTYKYSWESYKNKNKEEIQAQSDFKIFHINV
jgi:hypothetical protein